MDWGCLPDGASRGAAHAVALVVVCNLMSAFDMDGIYLDG